MRCRAQKVLVHQVRVLSVADIWVKVTVRLGGKTTSLTIACAGFIAGGGGISGYNEVSSNCNCNSFFASVLACGLAKRPKLPDLPGPRLRKRRVRSVAFGICIHHEEKPSPGPSNLFDMITKRLTMKGFIVRAIG